MATPILDVTLTGTDTDNQAELEVKNIDSISLHVAYTKGTESHGHVRLSFSTINDDEGSEVWCDWSDINQTQGVDHHLIENDPFRFADTGNYRLFPMDIGLREDKIRIQAWADTPGATPGSMVIYVVTNKQRL